jgi:DNA processing protein
MSQEALDLSRADRVGKSISPLIELGAYEQLWTQETTTFKRLAEMFRAYPCTLPSDLVPKREAEEMAQRVLHIARTRGVPHFGVRIHHAGEYPQKLRDAKDPVELLYYRGWWNLVESPCVAVVGTRKPTPDGIQRTRKLVRNLVEDGQTIVSGLAAGVDTVAHRTALEAKGTSIAVLGTPISETYPPENAELQEHLATAFLVISQVPIYRYVMRNWRTNRLFFPQRNITMSALTAATIIVEAGETSGTLIQARAALQQGRKLFILASCFEQADLTWPARYEAMGAIRVRDYSDIHDALRANGR